MKPDNSREYYEWRMAERLAGRLNAPRRGLRGLGALIAKMSGRGVHPLTCKCAECIPPEVEAWMRANPQIFPQNAVAGARELPAVTSATSASKLSAAMEGPREACATCDSSGRVRSWSGALIPCPCCLVH